MKQRCPRLPKNSSLIIKETFDYYLLMVSMRPPSAAQSPSAANQETVTFGTKYTNLLNCGTSSYLTHDVFCLPPVVADAAAAVPAAEIHVNSFI